MKFPCALLKMLFHELYKTSPLKLIIGKSLSSGLKIESKFWILKRVDLVLN